MNNTRLTDVNQLRAGMVVAEDIYDSMGHLIVSHELSLTVKMIMRLKLYNVDTVKVYGQENDNIRAAQDRVTRSSHIVRSLEFKEFKKQYLERVEEFKDTINDVVYSDKPINKKHMLNDINKFIESSPSKTQLFIMLRHLKQYDDAIYMHSYNVAIIARMFGIWLKKTQEEIDLLTLCGMLHDVGKIVIPEEILNKNVRLTPAEYDIIRSHTVKGYEILKDKDVDERIKLVALQHHERRNGTGYPMGLEKTDMCEFSQIISIADTYDAMTARRPYRLPVSPFRVFEFFQEEGFDLFEAKFLLPFVENAEQTYLYNKVTLTNGVEGEIIMLNAQKMSKPLIKTRCGFIDLNQERDLEIEDVL